MGDIKPALTPSMWEYVHDDLAYVEKMVDGASSYLDGYEDITNQRHALAALALYQQPFGFTREDVSDLLLAARGCHADYADRYESLAARVAALLPPSP